MDKALWGGQDSRRCSTAKRPVLPRWLTTRFLGSIRWISNGAGPLIKPSLIALSGLATTYAGLQASLSLGPSDIAGTLIPVGMVIVLVAGFLAQSRRRP